MRTPSHRLLIIFAELTVGGLWLLSLAAIALPPMALDSSGVRAMRSATGLLYVATGLVLPTEILTKRPPFARAVAT